MTMDRERENAVIVICLQKAALNGFYEKMFKSKNYQNLSVNRKKKMVLLEYHCRDNLLQNGNML